MELLRVAAQGRDHLHLNLTPSSLLLHEGHSSAKRRMGFTAPWHIQDQHCSQGRKLCSCANTRTKAREAPVPTPVSSSHSADSSTAQLCLHSLPAAAPLHPRCAGTRRAQGEASCLIFFMSQGSGIDASCRKCPRVCAVPGLADTSAGQGKQPRSPLHAAGCPLASCSRSHTRTNFGRSHSCPTFIEAACLKQNRFGEVRAWGLPPGPTPGPLHGTVGAGGVSPHQSSA